MWRWVLVCLVLYGCLVAVRPLWLDEVIQLSVTTQTEWRDVFAQVKQNPGGVPLGYAAQRSVISIAGPGTIAARLPSLMAGLGSLVVLLLIAKELGVRGSAIAALLWMVCPLSLRYALEGRPYMLGLLFASVAVFAQIRLAKTANPGWAGVLALSLTAAVYSQPYALLAPVGFSIASAWQKRDPRHAVLTFGAYALAALAFLPWFVEARAPGADAVVRIRSGFEWGPSLRVLLRESFGDGYLAAIPVLLLALCGARREKIPLVAAVAAGMGGARAADALADYFFAIRQAIYVLPALLLLACDAAVRLWERQRVAAAVAVALIAGASVGKDVRYFADRSEDWDRLAEALASESGCILIAGEEPAALYEVFRPEIGRRLCGAGLADRVIMPVHRYTTASAEQRQAQKLLHAGLRAAGSQRVGFARIELFVRQSTDRPSTLQWSYDSDRGSSGFLENGKAGHGADCGGLSGRRTGLQAGSGSGQLPRDRDAYSEREPRVHGHAAERDG